jgi:hypothetical protein
MNIPDSIRQLMSERISDPFVRENKKSEENINEAIAYLRQKIKPDQAYWFDQGTAYFKNSSTDRQFIKGVLCLYIETVVNAIRNSGLSDKSGTGVLQYFENQTKAIIQLVEHQQLFLDNFTDNKKLIDVEEISFIILGYAIETIRKIHNLKSQQRSS